MEKAGDDAYVEYLEGRQLLGTLDELAAAFWQKRRWTINRSDLAQPGQEGLSPLTVDDETSPG